MYVWFKIVIKSLLGIVSTTFQFLLNIGVDVSFKATPKHHTVKNW